MDDVEENRKKNFEQRLKYIEEYEDWVKMPQNLNRFSLFLHLTPLDIKNTPNKIWSKRQKEMIDSVLRSADRIRTEGVVVKGD